MPTAGTSHEIRTTLKILPRRYWSRPFSDFAAFEGRSTFGSWLQRIKINHCLNYLKKQAGRSYVGVEERDVEEFDQLKVHATAEQQAGAISDRQLISQVLDSMSNTLRIPLLLCDMDELSYEEVAQSLHISLSAAKMRIKRAREEFRERYQQMQTAGVQTGTR